LGKEGMKIRRQGDDGNGGPEENQKGPVLEKGGRRKGEGIRQRKIRLFLRSGGIEKKRAMRDGSQGAKRKRSSGRKKVTFEIGLWPEVYGDRDGRKSYRIHA